MSHVPKCLTCSIVCFHLASGIQGISLQSEQSNSALIRWQILIFANILSPRSSQYRATYASFNFKSQFTFKYELSVIFFVNHLVSFLPWRHCTIRNTFFASSDVVSQLVWVTKLRPDAVKSVVDQMLLKVRLDLQSVRVIPGSTCKLIVITK